MGGKLEGDAKRVANLTVGLGSFTHTVSDVFEVFRKNQFKINANHPVIKEAIHKGRTLFVISSVYQTEKAEIKVSMMCCYVIIHIERDHTICNM